MSASRMWPPETFVGYMNENITPDPGSGRNIEPELDRKREFAKRASVSVRSVDNWIHDRRIPYLKIGRKVRYRLSDLDAWLETRTRKNT